MQGVRKNRQRGKQGEGLVKRGVFMEVLYSVHIPIIARVCSHLMNIVFRL
jgi:hypothetical protein